MVDLKAMPYYLQEEDIRWVEETICAMTPEEKVGQLFFQLTASQEEDYLRELVEQYHVGGCRYNPAPGEAISRQNQILQKYSRVPLFIACNTEAGGDGACQDGTYIGAGIKIAATDRTEYARDLGRMANGEASAIGCNMAFAPVCDIVCNWENTEIISRAFGSDPERVARMSQAYIEGAHENAGFACVAKHFPGNGVDLRDAHLSNHVNSLSVEEWERSFGLVYRTLIENGLEGIMGGHIMLPEYAKEIRPQLKDEEMLPATLSYEIMTVLLREKLGFNGMVVTDASHMVAMTDRMTRREMLPLAINAGCDMFLFFNDPQEDFSTMLEAYQSGIISEERMQEALKRILGLKAHLGLHRHKENEQGIYVSLAGEDTIMQLAGEKEGCKTEKRAQDEKLAEDQVQCREQETSRDQRCDEKQKAKEEALEIQRAISRDSLTLVKYKDQQVLPITPERYKRIMVVHIRGAENGMTAFKKMLGMGGENAAQKLISRLQAKGFEAFLYESPLDVMKQQVAAGEKPNLNFYFAGKNAIADFVKDMDLVITLCDVDLGRPVFGFSKGGGEIPWYVFEIPVVVIGCGQPTILADIPQARTYINTYDAKDSTMDALVEALMKGPEAFGGIDPIDSFCGMWDTRI